jgi:hypothetical protein
MVLGHPDRHEVLAAAHEVGFAVAREIQVQIRAPGWLQTGTGSFHDTVVDSPLAKVLPLARHDTSATVRVAS